MKTQLLLGLAASATALAACGGGDNSKEAQEKRIEETAKKYGVNADVTLDKDSEVDKVVINNGLGQYGQGLDLPSGFPQDVALPAGANIMAATNVPGQKNAFSIQALSNDDADTIINSVTSQMETSGWTKSASDQPTPQMRRIGFEKDDRMANFVITANGETNMVQLVTMTKP